MSQGPRNIGIGSLIHYRFPLPAIVSILHRISGILLFIFIPFLLFILSRSLHSQQGFMQLKACLNSVWGKSVCWIFLAAFIYHFIAGIKHLLLDIGLFETQRSARVASIIVLCVAVILIVLTGVWLIW